MVPQKCTVAPFCIFIVTAVAERRKTKKSIIIEQVWIGEEISGDRNKTLLWKNRIHIVKGMPKKVEGRNSMPK